MISIRFITPLVTALGLVSAVVSAQPAAGGDYRTVTSKLDAGGSYFMYMETRGSVERIAGLFDKLVQSTPDNPEALFIPRLVRSGGLVLGINSIEAVGGSEVALPDGGSRQKSYLLMRKPEGLFALLGKPTGPMDIARFAPADAAVASVKSLNYDRIIPLVRRVATIISREQGDSAITEVLTQAKQGGVDLEAMLASLEGETLFWLRLDESNKVTIPMKGGQVTFARPGAMLALRTRGSVVFDTLKRIADKKPEEVAWLKSENGTQMLLPKTPDNPWGLKPMLVYHDNLLIVATSADDLKLAEHAAKTIGVFESAEFTKVAAGMPATPSTMGYISPRVSAFVKNVLGQLESKADDSEIAGVMSTIRGVTDTALPGKDGLAMWSAWDADGLLMVWQGDKMGMQMSQSNVALAGVVVAIAVPAFLRARENSRGQVCQENLSKMDGAKEQWALEFRKPMGTTVTMENLIRPDGAAAGMGYLKRIPTCPSGGTYHLNAVGEAPTCSIGDSNKPFVPHVLP